MKYGAICSSTWAKTLSQAAVINCKICIVQCILHCAIAFISVSQASFHAGNNKIIFHIPKKKTPVHENVYRSEKQTGSWQPKKITPALPTAGQKFPQHIEVYLEFYAVLKSCKVFIPPFIAEALIIFAEPWLGNTVLNGHLLQTQISRVAKIMAKNFQHKPLQCQITTDIKSIESSAMNYIDCARHKIFHTKTLETGTFLDVFL